MLKSVILGCGPRAEGHAVAYRFVKKAKLAAVCDVDRERLDAFADTHGVPAKYSDLHEMLDREKPDLLHIVTRPNVRVPLLTIAHEHNLPGVIVEKPLAVDNSDFNALADLAKVTSTKIAVNHQLHYHPKVKELLEDVRVGSIGEVRCIDASARMNLAGQGTHMLNLVFAFNSGIRPNLIFGNVSGKDSLESEHPGPDMAVAQINFPNGVRCLFASGLNALCASDDDRVYMHKRITVHGTLGYVSWTMESWERAFAGASPEGGVMSYAEEDDLGQAAMTDAMADWLQDDGQQHANCFEASLAESNTVLGLYSSAVHGKPIELPYESDEPLIDALNARP